MNHPFTLASPRGEPANAGRGQLFVSGRPPSALTPLDQVLRLGLHRWLLRGRQDLQTLSVLADSEPFPWLLAVFPSLQRHQARRKPAS